MIFTIAKMILVFFLLAVLIIISGVGREGGEPMDDLISRQEAIEALGGNHGL